MCDRIQTGRSGLIDYILKPENDMNNSPILARVHLAFWQFVLDISSTEYG